MPAGRVKAQVGRTAFGSCNSLSDGYKASVRMAISQQDSVAARVIGATSNTALSGSTTGTTPVHSSHA